MNLYKNLTKRQVIVYKELYKHVQTDDELAAMLAREISIAMKSYSGMWGGRIDSIQVALGSKKFEMVADKRAVDYMVTTHMIKTLHSRLGPQQSLLFYVSPILGQEKYTQNWNG